MFILCHTNAPVEVSVWLGGILLWSGFFAFCDQVACRCVEGLWELPAAAWDSLGDEDQGVEGLLARAGRLLPRCIHQDVCCVAKGGRGSLSWSWIPSCAPQRSW